MTEKQFDIEFEKLAREYSFNKGRSSKFGSVEIVCMITDDNKRIAGVNWSCCGDVSPKDAKPFLDALTCAIDACEKFNASHNMNDI